MTCECYVHGVGLGFAVRGSGFRSGLTVHGSWLRAQGIVLSCSVYV